MRYIAIISALAFTMWGAYWQGHRVGLRASPEFAKVQDVHNRELEAFFAAQFAEPTSREQMCDQITDLVAEELRNPIAPDQ